MICEPNIFAPREATNTGPNNCHQADSERAERGAVFNVAEENFDGKKSSGRFEPGEARAVISPNDAVPTSAIGAGPRQSNHLAGGGAGVSAPSADILKDEGEGKTDRGARSVASEGGCAPPAGATSAGIETATAREAKILAYRALTMGGIPTRRAARKVGEKFHTLYNWCRAYDVGGLDALLPQRHLCGRKRKAELQLNPAEVAAVRANKILNNRDKKSGSTPLAILKTIEEGGLRPAIAAELLGRLAAGKEMVTPATADELHISPIHTRTFRNARNAWLDFNSSPGSLQMTRDEVTGETRLIQPGEFCTIDDGTKNFICTVPLQRPEDKCWQKYGVVVGRWQILVLVDHRTYFIMGVNHTARPKGSYRAEDLQACLHIGFKQHGRPRKVILERGISNARLLHHTLDQAGVNYQHVKSPHQKVVETVFNGLWSRLSFLPGQVGRTRGEEAEVDALVRSCATGATDPRDYFLPLDTVLRELKKVCEEWNAHLIKSRNYGNWTPKDFFAAEAPKHLRELHPKQEWIFSPTIADNNGHGYLVRKQNITTSYPVMPGYSWQFDFEAPFFQEFYGARVRLHYNAFEPECPAMVVLQHPFHGKPAGAVLGEAEQINMHTRHCRRLFGIEEADDIGLLRTRRNAQQLHRNTFGIRPDGKPGVQAHEARSGTGEMTKISAGEARSQEPGVRIQPPRRGMLAPQTPEQISRQSSKFERLAARQRELLTANER